MDIESGEQLRICPAKQRRARALAAARGASAVTGAVAVPQETEIDVTCPDDCPGQVYEQRTILGKPISVLGYKAVCPLLEGSNSIPQPQA